MSEEQPKIKASRIVVIMPNWLGDAVMATPFLRALRSLYPQTHIAAVARPLAAAMCYGLVDEVKPCGKGDEGAVAQWMRGAGGGQKFDLGILLPNSFRSAWMLWRGSAKRRLGYARDRRSCLLTDRIPVVMKRHDQRTADQMRQQAIRQLGGGRARVGSPYHPVPTIDYYLDLAKYLGAAAETSRQMELHISDEGQREGDAALTELNLTIPDPIENRKSKIKNYALLVPGANFGASKCWDPGRFAQVAECLADPGGEFRLHVLLVGSPAETPICQAIVDTMGRHRAHVAVLGRVNGGKGVSVGGLKEIVCHARLMVCNDTGPRHMAVALGIPLVTLFGPTDPVWAETFYQKERLVRVEVPCGPCQLKVCPIDHRCMQGITVEMVMAAVRALWS